MFGIYRYGLAFCVAISHLWGGMIAGPAAYAVWGFLLPQRLPDDPDSEREVRFHAARPDQVRGQSALRIYRGCSIIVGPNIHLAGRFPRETA